MLARQYRLPSSISLRNASTSREDFFIIKSQKNSYTYNRYGFVVSKAIDKSAVVRNRLRRVFRSCIEGAWLEKGAGRDILFILSPKAKNVTKEVLQAKIDMVLSKIS